MNVYPEQSRAPSQDLNICHDVAGTISAKIKWRDENKTIFLSCWIDGAGECCLTLVYKDHRDQESNVSL